jgi:hypothetical protein
MSILTADQLSLVPKYFIGSGGESNVYFHNSDKTGPFVSKIIRPTEISVTPWQYAQIWRTVSGVLTQSGFSTPMVLATNSNEIFLDYIEGESLYKLWQSQKVMDTFNENLIPELRTVQDNIANVFLSRYGGQNYNKETGVLDFVLDSDCYALQLELFPDEQDDTRFMNWQFKGGNFARMVKSFLMRGTPSPINYQILKRSISCFDPFWAYKR